jgi:hypothetical protein
MKIKLFPYGGSFAAVDDIGLTFINRSRLDIGDFAMVQHYPTKLNENLTEIAVRVIGYDGQYAIVETVQKATGEA